VRPLDPRDPGLLADALGRLPAETRVALGAYAVIAVVLVVDLSRRRRPVGAARLGSLAVTAAAALLFAVPVAAVVAGEWAVLARLAPDALTSTWARHPVPAAVACFVVVDLVAYAYHRVGHATRVGWASHRVHHLGRSFDMTLVLRQPWVPVHGLAIVPLTALAGFPLPLAAACSSISLAYQAVQHSGRAWSLGRLDAVLVSGRAHLHHHDAEGGHHELGAVLRVWDHLFGTAVADLRRQVAEVGTGEPEPLSPLRCQADGWRALVGRAPESARR
jgi:sterol desaturase/sphingolipid hydroxylase (fatty acid hydroxylase superfamily)